MDLRLFLAILVGKTVALATKLTGSGSTAAPGLYALRIDPKLVKKLSETISGGAIIIAGTNGKTTTSRIVSDIAETQNEIIHNRQGSNLLRGLASTLVKKATLGGHISQNLAIWETDEAALPEIINQTNPKTIVLLNLFRDQLDRYGEVETIRKKWQDALSKLPKETTLILNADDPQLGFFTDFKGKIVAFGVEETKLDLPSIENVADVRYCLKCGNLLDYSMLYSAHLGHWLCAKCNSKRQKPSVTATSLKFKTDFSTSLQLRVSNKSQTINYNLPGLYNVYNVLAATAAASSQSVEPKTIQDKIEAFSSAFGRFQKIKIKGKNVVIFLIKNPAGANEVIRTISLVNKVRLLAILNDNFADGRDISWIWDTSWEALAAKVQDVTVGGTRAWDLATRFKYAGIILNKDDVQEDINYSMQKSLNKMDNKDTLMILPTYTAMLELQKHIGGQWHKD